jgi:peptidoglycan hydrolase-like protein with peptidoglycan-binding domain
MAIIGVLLNPGDTGAKVRELHEQLRNVGAVLDSGEQATTNYGPSTVATFRAFRQRHGSLAGDALDLPTGG